MDDRLHCSARNPSLFCRRKKRGPEEPIDHALGCSRGDLTTEVHLVCDANGIPLRFLLSSGQAATFPMHSHFLIRFVSGKSGRPRKRCCWLLADQGYGTDHLRQYYDRYRMKLVIPQRTMKRRPKPGLPRFLFDRNIDSATSSSECSAC